MEESLRYSPKLGLPLVSDDLGFVTRNSTVLVATIQEVKDSIQEAKDKIGQIEFIFCKQLYSNFQAKAKSLQQIYLDVKKEAEDRWKEREKDLLIHIERLECEKQEVLEEIRCIKIEHEKALEEKTKSSLLKERRLEIRIDELEEGVRRKSKEVDDGMILHNQLIQLVQTKSSLVLDKAKQVEEYEEKTNGLLDKLKSLEALVEKLEMELERKNEDNNRFLSGHEEERRNLAEKVEYLEDDISKLQKKLFEKTEEIEDGLRVKALLIQQIHMNDLDILKQKQQVEEYENEKRQLLRKVNCLEENINELKKNLSSKETEGKDSYNKLLQQIELKDTQLLVVKKKKEDMTEKYKNLKSQYKFLLEKCGLTEENMLPQVRLEDESSPLTHEQNPTTSSDFGRKCSDNPAVVYEMKKVKLENDVGDGLVDDKVVKSKMVKSIPLSSYLSPTSTHNRLKCPPTAKSAPVIGTKRPASRWIETRSRQNGNGPDPHDDFLNTPLENIKGTLNEAAINKTVHNPQLPVQKDIHADNCCSDDETQDMNIDPGPQQQQVPLPKGGQKGFKYIEPVRKKADRENLKGVECKQCKKFYDAVLPNGGKGTDGDKQNIRCEHHEGVSRHRYKYAPPLTPDGFWNIGFESEM